MASEALLDLAPDFFSGSQLTLLSSLPTTFHSYCSLPAPETYQDCSYLRAFTLAISSAWDPFFPDFQRVGSFLTFRSQLKHTSLERASPELTNIKRIQHPALNAHSFKVHREHVQKQTWIASTISMIQTRLSNYISTKREIHFFKDGF